MRFENAERYGGEQEVIVNIALDASTLSLSRDGVIAIRDAHGVRVRCVSGALWITENSCTADTILLPGDSITLQRPGLTLIMALEGASLTLYEPHADLWSRVKSGLRRWLPRAGRAAHAQC
jgi:hypothetical protein